MKFGYLVLILLALALCNGAFAHGNVIGAAFEFGSGFETREEDAWARSPAVESPAEAESPAEVESPAAAAVESSQNIESFLDIPDTCQGNFFAESKKTLRGCGQQLGSYILGDQDHNSNAKKVAPANSQSQISFHRKKDLRWWHVLIAVFVGYLIYRAFKRFSKRDVCDAGYALCSFEEHTIFPFSDKRLPGPNGQLVAVFKPDLKDRSGRTAKETWLTEDLSSPTSPYLASGTFLYKSQMPWEEAKTLGKQWLEIKEKALGFPIQAQAEVLNGSLLSKTKPCLFPASAKTSDHPYTFIDASDDQICLNDITQFISSMRARLTSTCHDSKENDVAKQVFILASDTGYYDMLIHVKEDYHIVLRFRMLDIYFIGYALYDDADGQYVWFELEDCPGKQLIEGSTLLGLKVSYMDLEHWANTSIQEISFGYNQLRNAVYELKKNSMLRQKRIKERKAVARSVLTLILTFSESIRFKHVTSKIEDHYLTEECHLTAKEANLLLNWKAISTYIIEGVLQPSVNGQKYELDDLKEKIHFLKVNPKSYNKNGVKPSNTKKVRFMTEEN